MRFYLTTLVLVVFLLLRLPPVWRLINGFMGGGKGDWQTPTGLAAFVGGMVVLTTPLWAGAHAHRPGRRELGERAADAVAGRRRGAVTGRCVAGVEGEPKTCRGSSVSCLWRCCVRRICELLFGPFSRHRAAWKRGSF